MTAATSRRLSDSSVNGGAERHTEGASPLRYKKIYSTETMTMKHDHTAAYAQLVRLV